MMWTVNVADFSRLLAQSRVASLWTSASSRSSKNHMACSTPRGWNPAKPVDMVFSMDLWVHAVSKRRVFSRVTVWSVSSALLGPESRHWTSRPRYTQIGLMQAKFCNGSKIWLLELWKFSCVVFELPQECQSVPASLPVQRCLKVVQRVFVTSNWAQMVSDWEPWTAFPPI